MNHWSRWLKDSVQKMCKVILTISYRQEKEKAMTQGMEQVSQSRGNAQYAQPDRNLPFR